MCRFFILLRIIKILMLMLSLYRKILFSFSKCCILIEDYQIFYTLIFVYNIVYKFKDININFTFILEFNIVLFYHFAKMEC